MTGSPIIGMLREMFNKIKLLFGLSIEKTADTLTVASELS